MEITYRVIVDREIPYREIQVTWIIDTAQGLGPSFAGGVLGGEFTVCDDGRASSERYEPIFSTRKPWRFACY